MLDMLEKEDNFSTIMQNGRKSRRISNAHDGEGTIALEIAIIAILWMYVWLTR